MRRLNLYLANPEARQSGHEARNTACDKRSTEVPIGRKDDGGQYHPCFKQPSALPKAGKLKHRGARRSVAGSMGTGPRSTARCYAPVTEKGRNQHGSLLTMLKMSSKHTAMFRPLRDKPYFPHTLPKRLKVLWEGMIDLVLNRLVLVRVLARQGRSTHVGSVLWQEMEA